ncbi:uncharacterized protein METZ01_LOCUS463597, partial [marine metagenome]
SKEIEFFSTAQAEVRNSANIICFILIKQTFTSSDSAQTGGHIRDSHLWLYYGYFVATPLGSFLQRSLVLQSGPMTAPQHLFADHSRRTMLQSHYHGPIFQSASIASIPSRSGFASWFEYMLERYRSTIGNLIVAIDNPAHLSRTEKMALLSHVDDTNMVIYQCRSPRTVGHDAVLQLASQVGLRRLDANLCANTTGLTELRVQQNPLHRRYLPYSQRPLNWHTDGYYQPPARHIRGMLLHCIQDADGGD